MSEASHTSASSQERPPAPRKSSSFGLGLVLAILITIAATGLVPYDDFVYVFLASIYIYLMSLYVFPPVTPAVPPSVFAGNKLLKRYVMFAAIVGIFLPLAYLMLGLLLGNKMVVKPAARHTFLLVCQVVSEHATSQSHAISLPARGLVPILYNSARLVWIWSWMQTHFSKGAGGLRSGSEMQWAIWGGILAIANMILWSYNLFGFLLPMYLPRFMRIYYEDEKIWKAMKETVKASKD